MAFWGCEVKPGKPTPFVPPPEGNRLHVSQACLSTKAKAGAKAALRVRVSEDGEPLLVCVLREGGTEFAPLDLVFDQYTEFSVEGGAAIHLTGYFIPEYDGEGDSDDEEGYGRILGYDENGVPVLAGDVDSDESSDYGSEDSEEEEEDDDSDVDPPRRIMIEDVTEREAKALPAPAQANGVAKGKAAGFNDDDVAASDDEEEGDEEQGEEDGSEEDDSEEEESEEDGSEEEPRPQAAPAAAQQAGQKRKAEQAAEAAKAAAAKQAKQQAAATPSAAQQAQQQRAEAPASASKPKSRKFPNGFEIEDLKMGRPDGKLAKPGKKVVMRYIGRLKSNGKVFDQTKGAATFSFRLGVGEVIKGWDRGVEGMRVGDKRRLTIPPAMAYGTSGVRGTIPPNAWLVFEVELVDVK